MSRFGHAARSLVGPWGAVAVVGLEVVNLLQRGRPWRGELVWTVDWMGIVLFAAGPLLAGLAAVDAARITRREALPVVGSAAQPWRAYVEAILWTAGPATLAHLVAFGTAIAMGLPGVLSSSVGWSATAVALLAQILQFWWYTIFGSVVGRFLSPVGAGLTAAVGGLAVFYVLGFGDRFDPFAVGGSTVSRLGLTWNVVYLGLQVLVLCVTAVVMAVSIRGTRRRRPVVDVTAGLGVVLVVGVASLVGPQQRTVAMEPTPPGQCLWGEPVVCVYAEHERIADAVYASVYEALDAARNNGYRSLVPELVHEVSRTYVPPRSEIAGVATDQLLQGDEWDTFDLLWDLSTPWHCPQIRGEQPPDDAYFQSMEALVFTWLTLLDEPAGPQVADLPEGLLMERRLDPEQARETKAFLDSCGF